VRRSSFFSSTRARAVAASSDRRSCSVWAICCWSWTKSFLAASARARPSALTFLTMSRRRIELRDRAAGAAAVPPLRVLTYQRIVTVLTPYFFESRYPEVIHGRRTSGFPS
jgi:hypothetical protein